MTQLYARAFVVAASFAMLSAQVAEFPATDDCDVGLGFDLEKGCQSASAIMPLLPCSSGSSEACLETDSSEDITSYTMDVRSASDHSKLTDTVTTAEGGGFGVDVSTSVGYMKQSRVSERSQAFFLGTAGTVKRDYVKNPVALKLTDAAKTFLDQDPQGFLERYGLHYIYAVVYGGSFLGSFTVNAKGTSDTTEVDTFSKFSARELFFKSSVSNSFSSQVSDMQGSIQTYAGAKWRGGSGVSLDPSSPTNMAQTFQKWEDSWRDSPKQLRVVTRKWIDSEEIQAIINTKSKAIQDAFNAPLITQVTRDALSSENGKMMLVAESVSQALAWPVTTQNRTLYQALTSLNGLVQQHQEQLAHMDEADAVLRQSEILNDDYSWFIADNLRFQFEDLTSVYDSTYICQSAGFRFTVCQYSDGGDVQVQQYTDGTDAAACRVQGKTPNQRTPEADCKPDTSLGPCEEAFGGASWSCVFPPHQTIHMSCPKGDEEISSGPANLPAGCVKGPGGEFWSKTDCASSCGSSTVAFFAV